MHEPPPAPARQTPLVVLVALVAAQGVGLAGLAVFFLVELVVSTPLSVPRAVMAALLTLLAGLGLLVVARGLHRRRRWARAPALVTQLLALPVGAGLVQGGRWYVGVPLIGWALGVLVLLFAPAVSDALED
jgi:hypothetical protein